MDLEILKGITVPFISALVYFSIEALKQATNNNKKVLTFIPIIAAFLGVVIGIICFLVIPSELELAASIWSAALIGGASGLAATGTHQIFKQISKQEDKSPQEEQKQEQ